MRESRAISSEIVLPELIDKLVRIAVEHAGADRGLLILLRDGEPRIEAEATTGASGVEVVVRHAAVTPFDLMQSALHYVIRTRKSVFLYLLCGLYVGWRVGDVLDPRLASRC